MTLSFPVLAAAVLLAATRPGAAGRGIFADGARIAWVGDSITHQCRYTRFLEDYAWTRYPKRRLTFLNSGVSGDRAVDVLARFASDVEPFHPSAVVFCLGMNDGGFELADEGRLGVFTEAMRRLLARTEKLGAQAVLVSPPPVDPDAVFPLKGYPAPRKVGPAYNGVLRAYTERLADLAAERRLPFADVHAALSATSALLKLENPAATLVPDGIHPGRAGAALMAVAVLEALGERTPRWRVRLVRAAAGGRSGEVRGAELRELSFGPRGPSFTLRAESLPWVLPRTALAAAYLSAGYRRLNSAVLAVEGLAPGRYALYVDGVRIVDATARAWAKGIELGLETLHPDWRQGEALAAVNAQRNRAIREGILELMEARKTLRDLERKGVSAGAEYERAHARLERLGAGLRAAGREIARLERRIEDLRRPRPHRYEIVLEPALPLAAPIR